MHIPDGLLDLRTAAVTGGIAAAGLGVALWHARGGRAGGGGIERKKVPLLGLSAAFVFAGQMLNFPVAGGTSGHMIGAVLTAALLGPSAAVIVIASVLIVQCFMFADGGVTALGANVLNMGLVGGVAGWIIYAGLSRLVRGLYGRIFAATFAAWASTVLAAVLCAGELAASGRAAWGVVFPAMAGVHMLIGIGEGIITALVLVAVARVRPELVIAPARSRGTTGMAGSRRGYGVVVVYGVLIAVGLALFVSPWASDKPDGLECVAKALGMGGQSSSVIPAPMPDYALEWLGRAGISKAAAGAVGTVAVLLFSLGLAWMLVPRAKAQAVAEQAGGVVERVK